MSSRPPVDAGRVLVIDDDRGFRFAMRKALSRAGFEVSEAESGEQALRDFARELKTYTVPRPALA